MFSRNCRVRKASLLIGCALAVSMMISCGIFEPRDSKLPDSVSGGEYAPASEPGVVIRNLENALGNTDAIAYGRLFSSDFVFVADPEDVLLIESQYGPIFDDWNIDVETLVADRLLDRIRKGWLALSDTTVERDTDSSYVVYHGYTLGILEEAWTYFVGTAYFHMRKDPSDNLWYIYRWEDFRLEAGDIPDSINVEGTWGILKGETRATN